MPSIPFTVYLEWTKSKLLFRYSQVTFELSQEKFLLGSMRGQEVRAKVDEYWNNPGANHTQRTQAAAYSAKEITATIHEREGIIAQLTEERFFIEHLLDWGGYAVDAGERPENDRQEHLGDGELRVSG